MNEAVWFQHGGVTRLYLVDGKLSLISLASKFCLQPRSIMIEEYSLPYNGATGGCHNFHALLQDARS